MPRTPAPASSSARHLRGVHDGFAHLRWHRFEQDCRRPGVLHADRQVDNGLRRFDRSPLGPVSTAQQADRLRPQPQVGHHRDPHVRKCFHQRKVAVAHL